MKTKLIPVLFAGACLLQNASAQTVVNEAKVPFNFMVGDAPMQAGEYRLKQEGPVLHVIDMDGKSSAFRLTIPTSRRTKTQHDGLLFTRYGENVYLTSLWTAGSREGHALQETKRQKTVAERYRTVEMASVPMQRRGR